MSEFFVYNKDYIGKCYWSEKKGKISSMFLYDEDYMHGNENWNIDPAIQFVSGSQPVSTGLLGAFRDAAPDRWGQNLIRHRYLRENINTKDKIRELSEVDYLLGVSDFARQGNLRFKKNRNGDFVHQYRQDEWNVMAWEWVATVADF